MTGSTGAREREASEEEGTDDTEHLEELPDGIGCTGIWEHLSERREDDD